MKKKLSLLLVCFILASIIIGCSGKSEQSNYNQSNPDEENKQGISEDLELKGSTTLKLSNKKDSKTDLIESQNKKNRGMVVKHNDWIYYVVYDSLYKAREDGTDVTKLADKVIGGLNIADGWIYYNELPYDNGNLYRMRLDGTEKTLIAEDLKPISSMIHGDRIYFDNHNAYDGAGIYSAKLDGTDLQHLVDRRTFFRGIVRDKILYQVIDHDDLHIVNLDGTEDVLLMKGGYEGLDRYEPLFFDGEWIYYNFYDGSNESYQLCRENIVGNKREIITDSEYIITNFYILGDTIYYAITSSDNNDGLWMVKVDGSQKTKLTDDEHLVGLQDIGDWIYYTGQYNRKMFRMKHDGSNREEMVWQ